MDLLAYPVSLIMKFWHWLLSFVVAPDSGIAWVGAVIMLVVTIRLLLARSMWKQMYSMRKIAALSSKMREIQKKYGKSDRQQAAIEVQKLYSDAGVHPAAGCIPILIQLPVFLGLYHVLINFAPDGKTIDEASKMSNGAFSPGDVNSFLHAQIFDAPLAAYVRMPLDQIEALGDGLSRTDIVTVAMPLFALSGLFTFINMRNSMKRQEAAKKVEEQAKALAAEEEKAGGPVVEGEVVAIDGEACEEVDPDSNDEDSVESRQQKDSAPDPAAFAEQFQESMAQSMKILMYLFPIFPIVGGLFWHFPIAIAIYWFTNNIWTLVQTHIFLNKLDKVLPQGGSGSLPPSAFM